MPAARAHHRTHDEQQHREQEEHFADSRQAIEERQAKAATQQQVRPSDASRAQAALHRLAAGRAGLTTISRAMAAPQRLDRTA
ncbi:hypothetical protein [Streptomyces sp. NPDC051657]|uniref:hypothetical protein n=1 Tax=unclassified Streptomyces TaxID=2593676 RepID=UPI0034259F97